MDIQEMQKLKFVRGFDEAFPSGRIFLVGGSVRDYFLGVESCDFDLVAEGVSLEELLDYLKHFGSLVSIEGRAFGVVKFRPSDTKFTLDIALPRAERYLPGQRRHHAEIKTKNITIEADLARRDFTVNAMAVDLQQIDKLKGKSLKSKALIDPFRGLDDLKNKLICAVGDPKERFVEDPTRILRGIRFAVKFDFTIETNTWQAMKDISLAVLAKFTDIRGRQIERVSAEMIGQEFTRAIMADPVKTICLYDAAGLLKVIFPEIAAMQGVPQPLEYHDEGDVYVHTQLALSNLPKDASLRLRLATLLHDVGKPATFQPAEQTGDRIRFNGHDQVGAKMAAQILRRLKMPGELTDDVFWLIQNHMKLLFSFPNMRKDKKKSFARNPLFHELICLATADALATIPLSGKPEVGFLGSVNKILDELAAEEASGRPLEIINGKEIIAVLKKKDPRFEPQIQGKLIGAIKKEINSLYDRGKIRSKEEAISKVEGYRE